MDIDILQAEQRSLGYNAVYQSTNPPVHSITTTMAVHSVYRPEYAYATSDHRYFWGKDPHENDTFTVAFKEAITLQRLVIFTGHQDHQNDYLHDGVVEYVQNASSVESSMCQSSSSYKVQGQFNLGKYAAVLNPPLTHVICLRLRLLKGQEEWLIVSTISINSAATTLHCNIVGILTVLYNTASW